MTKMSQLLADLLGLTTPDITRGTAEPVDETPDAPRPSLRTMIAELQSKIPERAVGEPGWEITRPAWPDSWFDARDPGDVAACRRLWASALLACIRDVVQDMNQSKDFDRKIGRVSAGWIGSRDFHEMCALAGVDGAAVVDRLTNIDRDAGLQERILNVTGDRTRLGGEADHD